MKKILTILFIVLLSGLIFAVVKILPDYYLNTGKDFYENKDYVAAYQNLNIANKLRPKDLDTRYYYAETLIKLKPSLIVQKELFNLYKMDLPDSAGLIAQQQVALWRGQIFEGVGQNYIQKAPFNNAILRWDRKKLPLKVGIEKTPNIPAYYAQSIKSAFLQWQTLSGGLVSFKFVDNLDDSDIKIEFEPFNQKNCTNSDCKYTVAYTEPTISGGELLKFMTITFYEANNLRQPFSQIQIYNTALHEIGHSLGIMGHSDNHDDIMYMEMNNTSYRALCDDDLNTLSLLYKLIPDMTNTARDNYDTSYQFFAPIVLGTESQIVTQKMKEAQNYINSAPDLPNGYIDLAAAYVDSKQYAKAIETMNKALFLSSNDSEKYIVYYNLAVIYMQIKDWNNLLKYAQVAKQLKDSPDLDAMSAMAYFNLGDKEQAKTLYATAIQNDPTNVVFSYNLAVIYLKEYNFAKVGKIMNTLIAQNPDARNDARVKSLSLITMFFK